jgi:hypothetical protein
LTLLTNPFSFSPYLKTQNPNPDLDTKFCFSGPVQQNYEPAQAVLDHCNKKFTRKKETKKERSDDLWTSITLGCKGVRIEFKEGLVKGGQPGARQVIHKDP